MLILFRSKNGFYRPFFLRASKMVSARDRFIADAFFDHIRYSRYLNCGVEYQLVHRPVFFASCWCYYCMCNKFNKVKVNWYPVSGEPMKTAQAVDLLSWYVLLFHFRPRDFLIGIFLLSLYTLCVHVRPVTRGVHGVRSHPPPQLPKVRIL